MTTLVVPFAVFLMEHDRR